MGDDISKQILNEYDANLELHEAFGKSVADLLERLLRTEGLDHLPIEYRIKDRASLAEKIVRPDKAGKYECLQDITDISGVRVVAFLQEDCKRICDIIHKNFIVDFENSVNKETLLDADRFGYASIHYVVSYSGVRNHLPEFRDFDGLKAEIQVRTVLQHSWASLDWKLRYKSRAEVPATLRRRLYRISALLETADSEFSSLSADARAIRADYRQQIEAGKYDIPIDAESVGIYIEQNLQLNRLVKRAQKKYPTIVRISGETHGRLASLLYSLEEGKITSLSDVHKVIKTNQAQHVEDLGRLMEIWKSSSSHTFLSIETMLRVLMTLSRPKEQAEAMISAAPINLALGLSLKKLVEERSTITA